MAQSAISIDFLNLNGDKIMQLPQQMNIANADRLALVAVKLMSVFIILLSLHGLILQLKELFYKSLFMGVENASATDFGVLLNVFSVIASVSFIKICLGVLLWVKASTVSKRIQGAATPPSDVELFWLGVRLLLVYYLIEYLSYVLLFIVGLLLRFWLLMLAEDPILSAATIIDIVCFVLLSILFFAVVNKGNIDAGRK